MKIAQVVCTFPPYKGGMGNVAEKYAEIAGRNGYLSTVFTPDYGYDSENISEFFVVEKLNSIIKHGNAAFLPQLFGRLNNFDIVHFHYPFFGADLPFWFLSIFFKKKFKLIIHYHMDVVGLPFFLKPFTWPSKVIFSSFVKQAHLVTCGSLDYVKNSQIKNVYKKHKNKFKEIEFGVDAKRFFSKTLNKKNRNKILFVGGLDNAHYFKGLSLLFEALSVLKNEEWELIIVGSGDLENDYIKQVSTLNISNRVKFLGNVCAEKLPSIYQESDFFVLPSINRNEAFGLVLLEAMASGVPVLSSDLPGVRRLFDDRTEGLYFKTKDKNDLTKKLKWFLSNKEKTKEMGFAGRALVEKRYDWEKISRKLIGIYEDLHYK